MKTFYKSVLIVPLFFLSSCLINRQRQSWLGALQQTHQADTGAVVRVYFDKQGNLYADKKLFIPYKNFFDPKNGEKTIAEKKQNGSLEAFYTINRNRLKELSSFYHLNGEGIASAKDSFNAVQQLITKKVSDSLNKMSLGYDLKTLVVFIHGFNDTDPTGDYQLAREAIRNGGYEKGRFIYLEIYWDGLTTNQGNPIYENIWNRALQNSAYVSLGLRQILSRLDPSTRIRIITHSLGASIGTGAIFNTTTKWRQNGFRSVGKKLRHDYDINYFELQKIVPTPLQNIRIAMVAPAIPGYYTFTDFNNRSPVVTVAENNINKVIVGYNVNDFAVTKRFLNMDMARYFGSTSLGCNKTRKGTPEFIRTQNAFIENKYSPSVINQLLIPVDFSLHIRKQKDEEHGLYYYFQHTDCVHIFLKELFE